MSADSRVIAVQPKQGGEIAIAPLTTQYLIERRDQIRDAIEQVMIPDLHYGIIPGTKGISLYKEGAELLLSMFHIAVEPVVTDLCTPVEVRFQVEVRGIHIQSKNFVGSGIGVCSSNEEKYRWRRVKSDREYQNAAPEHKRIKYNRDYEEKQVRQSPYDAFQTILSMAKKRAMTDLCKTALAASECLKTLKPPAPKPDIKKQVDETRNGYTRKDTPGPQTNTAGGSAGASAPKNTHSADVPGAGGPGGKEVPPQKTDAGARPSPAPALITQEQAETLARMIDNAGVPETHFLGQYEINDVRELEAARFEAAVAWVARMMG
jgi:hypothetical protein